jgi:hypothetical protein
MATGVKVCVYHYHHQPTTIYCWTRPLQFFVISLVLQLPASSSCQPSCANRHSTWPEAVLQYVYLDTVSIILCIYSAHNVSNCETKVAYVHFKHLIFICFKTHEIYPAAYENETNNNISMNSEQILAFT